MKLEYKNHQLYHEYGFFNSYQETIYKKFIEDSLTSKLDWDTVFLWMSIDDLFLNGCLSEDFYNFHNDIVGMSYEDYEVDLIIPEKVRKELEQIFKETDFGHQYLQLKKHSDKIKDLFI